MHVPVRKSARIPGYDYSSDNYYFVTICTHDKKCIFWMSEKQNWIGRIAQRELLLIPTHYAGVRIDKAVIMPNHIHAIIVIGCENKGEVLPSLNAVIGQYKSGVTRLVHKIDPSLKVWQRSYHDHIIRSQAGYEKIWKYIDGNPQKWKDDCFYMP